MPVIPNKQDRVYRVEPYLGQLSLLDDLLSTQGIMLVLCQVIYINLR